MSHQSVEPERTYVLPEYLINYPGRNTPQTQWVIEQLRACACIAMAARNRGELLVDDQWFTLNKGGDYTTIKVLVQEHKALTAIQLRALFELCSFVYKLDMEFLKPCSVALMLDITDISNIH